MPPKEIYEIENEYQRGKKLLILVVFFAILSFYSLFIPFPVYDNFRLLVFILFIFITFIIYSKITVISSYDKIRYDLTNLIKYLKDKNYKESEIHLNKLAYHVTEYNDELEENIVSICTKKTLKNFWDFLKNHVYPCVKDHDPCYLDILENINNANDISVINKILDEYEKLPPIKNEPLVFNYEKPPIGNQIITTISISYHKSIVFRFICILIFLFMIAYLIIIKTSLELKFDTTLIGALIIVSFEIAKSTK